MRHRPDIAGGVPRSGFLIPSERQRERQKSETVWPMAQRRIPGRMERRAAPPGLRSSLLNS
jgi:hypothetical protein